MKKTALLLSTVLGLWSGAALAVADVSSLPMEVVKAVQKLEADCKANPGKADKIATDLSKIKDADLNGDGLTDYIIEDAYVPCEYGASFRHGNGGTGVIIYVGNQSGAKLAYDETVFGVALKDGAVWVTVGGHYCGQKSFASRADAIGCERELKWNAKKKRFEFAPLSKARMLK